MAGLGLGNRGMILHPLFQLHQPPPWAVYSWAPTLACSAFFPHLLFFSFLFRKVRTFQTHTQSPSSKTEIQKPEVKERPLGPGCTPSLQGY